MMKKEEREKKNFDLKELTQGFPKIIKKTRVIMQPPPPSFRAAPFFQDFDKKFLPYF